MKTLGRFLIFVLFGSAGSSSALHAQTCVDPMRTVSYDTMLIGSGNNINTLTFPKFDATLGTLMEVNFRAEITLLYSFQLENRENVTINNYRVRVTRDDEISSTALLNPVSNTQIRTYGPYSLTSWDGNPGAGADYRAMGPLFVMNHQIVSQNVYNTADYLGVGTVDFDYASTTYSSVLGSVNYTYNATAQDTVLFRMTYTYCPTWFLKADVTSFHAVKNKSQGVDLSWITHNEEKERIYEIQKSYDGRNFETVDRKAAQPNATQTGSYRYTYSIGQEDKHPKIIFRLKEKEKNGEIKYSTLRVVDINLAATQEMRLYPNPASSSTQIVFNNSKRGFWKTELINMNGAVLKQQTFNNALTGRIDGLQNLPKGIYVLKATNQKTGEVMKQRLVVR